MPAITLGLAEIEERLHVLRRRLNTVTLLHAASLSLSTLFLVGAALVAVGLRGGVSSFRALTWSGIALVAGALIACVISARKRWLDVPATAALVDQRGQLTDRLTTLVDLRLRPRPTRFAPVLIAQTLALSERWRPQRVAPRRVPRSLFLVLLSLLVLSAAPLVAPEPPPAAASARPVKNQVLSPDGPQDAEPAASASLSGEGASAAAVRAGAHDASQPADEPQATATQMDAAPPLSAAVPPSAESAPETQLAMLPDRLRKAILSAFHAEPMDHGHQLGKAPAGQSKESAKEPAREPGATSAGDDRAGAEPGGDAGRRAPEGGESPAAPADGTTAPQRPGGSQADSQSPHAQQESGNQAQSGSAPNAGSGSNPEGLLGAGARAAESGPNGTTTFKLTITSFLHAAEEKDGQPRRPDERGSGSGVAAKRGGPAPALNQQQLRDDALRKAEIPPEYEDIVRRVYSTRALDVQNALPTGQGWVAATGNPTGSGAPKGRGAPPADQ